MALPIRNPFRHVPRACPIDDIALPVYAHFRHKGRVPYFRPRAIERAATAKAGRNLTKLPVLSMNPHRGLSGLPVPTQAPARPPLKLSASRKFRGDDEIAGMIYVADTPVYRHRR